MLRDKVLCGIAVGAVLIAGSFPLSRLVYSRTQNQPAMAVQPPAAIPPDLAPNTRLLWLQVFGKGADQPIPPELDEEGNLAITSAEPRIPPPDDNLPPLWEPLDRAVRSLAEESPGRISVVAIDLTSGVSYHFRASDQYLPASTFKLPVVLCTVKAIDAGRLTWDTMVTYTEDDYSDVGAGAFVTASFGEKYTIRNLVDRSIISSNNVTVQMLARTLTWDGLFDCTSRIGGPVTRSEYGSTPVTAASEAAWWLELWHMHQNTPKLAEELLRPLRQVAYKGRIAAGTPRSDLVTHKFGTLPPYENDGAIIWGDRPYILVVLTAGVGHTEADGVIAQVAHAAWDAIYTQGG